MAAGKIEGDCIMRLEHIEVLLCHLFDRCDKACEYGVIVIMTKLEARPIHVWAHMIKGAPRGDLILEPFGQGEHHDIFISRGYVEQSLERPRR